MEDEHEERRGSIRLTMPGILFVAQMVAMLVAAIYFVASLEAGTRDRYTGTEAAADKAVVDEKLADLRRDVSRLERELAGKPPTWLLQRLEQQQRRIESLEQRQRDVRAKTLHNP